MAHGNEENWAPPTESLTGVRGGLMVDASNFQGDAGAGGLGTVLFRNTSPIKLTVSVLGNFSGYTGNEYTYSPKLPGLKHPQRHPS